MSVSGATGVVITNPLVKYRALLATKTLNPDPAQHRLAIHLQRLYDQLKDYEPQIEYSTRLDQLSRTIGDRNATGSVGSRPHRRQSWREFLPKAGAIDSVALTRRLTSQESALQLKSPRGLMLHGEVGTGKSMLIDLFADCLPTRKKRRWHFNNFMLETFGKLEALRRQRIEIQSTNPSAISDDDYSMLGLAKDMIETSPILFLDEFQLPDRAASKIMTSLMTSFFHLGGVLIATSNRMPEELAKAAGLEFSPPPSQAQSLVHRLGLKSRVQGNSERRFAGSNEFIGFLEVLKARCEVWEMESVQDYRRMESGSIAPGRATEDSNQAFSATQASRETLGVRETEKEEADPQPATIPANYLVVTGDDAIDLEDKLLLAVRHSADEPIVWSSSSLTVYGRTVPIARTCDGMTWWTFDELCRSTLGPADYISLASTYHTIILSEVPTLTWLMKNEARRFITLLDALYECRCKLFVTAQAGPDDIFFPDETLGNDEDGDAVHSETFAEAYQDATAPFRPNVLMQNPNYAEPEVEPDYTHVRLQGILSADALEDDPPNKPRRSGFARSFGRTDSEMERGPIDPDAVRYASPNFSKTSAFTGEDERFAYKRAQSRLWEMCSERWWNRAELGWHCPVPSETRRWERAMPAATSSTVSVTNEKISQSDVALGESTIDDTRDERSFRHISSPFRTIQEPPPKFSWTHIWGTMKWGPKAGAWGQGVDGLKDRGKEKR